MSKRQSAGQANTLLNYFQSPKGKQNVKEVKTQESDVQPNLEYQQKMNSDKDEDEVSKLPSKKRNRAIIDSDSDEDPPVGCTRMDISKTLVLGNDESSKAKRVKRVTERKRACHSSKSDSDEDYSESSESSLEGKGKAKRRMLKKTAVKSFCFEKSERNDTNKENIEKKIASTKVPKNVDQSSDVAAANGENWLHNKLEFLKPKHIRDINKYRPDHPDYDERTLYVPDEFLNKQTPAMRQWWILKSKHYDSVLFFKVGKFYELYHMDAVIGVNYLGFSYMKGEFAHSGFPEVAYGRMASSLVEQGFKVARVEQTETPQMMAQRCKTILKPGKFDKVVTREICQITTTATCVYGAQLTDAKQPLPCYMLAVAEKQIQGGSRFGVCFIDTSIGLFYLGEFDDDRHCSRLLALLAEHSVSLILIERGRLQNSTVELLKKTLGSVRRDTLAPNTQFYTAQNTLDLLMKGCYFRDKNNEFQWPPVLRDLIEDGCPKKEFELLLKALGACLWYLKDSELDIHILPMKKFELYRPSDTAMSNRAKKDFMVLDSMTMENLSLLGSTGTLQKTLDFCETAFGKRHLQRWICRPLCVLDCIVARQEAIHEMYINDEVRQAVRAILKKLPDLERQVAKIHIFGNRFCATLHPDSRAVLYEAKTYSKRKILDLITTITGFEKAQEITNILTDYKSVLLRNATQHPPVGSFPDLSKTLQFFREAFDQKQAETEGKIIPQRGVVEDYDNAEQAIADIQQETKDYLHEQEKIFGCKLTYFGTDKKRFQIEIPEAKTHKVTTEYLLEGTKRGSKPAKRYSTPTTRRLLADMIKAETRRNQIVQDLNRRIFEKFSDRYDEWKECIENLKMLDVICSCAEYAARAGLRNVCFPKILPFQDVSYVNIENGVHPCTLLEDFVPNSTKLGSENAAKIMILTGPNMGGKSTLMRQVALIIIMAQMGCPVPAEKCEISLVDRIFTRLGAHDDILQGQSTFMVELSEASAILQHATQYSFVLLDELGRGTSTHDGNAIATAYVQKLTEIECRTIFSTHYHTLVDQFSGRSDIQLAHMACMSDEDREEEKDDPLQSVTLLYQLREGNCPKSYGFNAAKLAGLPGSIIQCAHKVASALENTTKARRLICDLLSNDAAVAKATILSLQKK